MEPGLDGPLGDAEFVGDLGDRAVRQVVQDDRLALGHRQGRDRGQQVGPDVAGVGAGCVPEPGLRVGGLSAECLPAAPAALTG